jgi:hypothetical protein
MRQIGRQIGSIPLAVTQHIGHAETISQQEACL